MKCKTIVAVAALCSAFAVAAEERKLGVEITPFGGYRFGGTFNVEGDSASYKIDDAASAGLLVNFPHRGNTKWELLYSQQSSEARFDAATINDSIVDVDLQVLQLGGTYEFDGDKVVPYLAATLGATRAEVSSRGSASDTYWSASLGLGVLVSPASRVGLRFEARGYSTFMSSSTDLFCQTGPDQNVCAAQLEGDLLTQIEVFAGVVLRF